MITDYHSEMDDSTLLDTKGVKIYQMMIEGRKMGMITLEQDLQRLYKSGSITNRTAMNFANNKSRMMQLLTSQV